MNYYRFFLANRNILLFAIILTLYSGFGQTFILSLYIPEIIKEFQISQRFYSSIYAAATLCSGITIIFAGRVIDRMPIMKFTMLVIAGIIAANLVAGLSLNLIMLFLAIFMLRFFGQGLLTHTSMTSMGRYFSRSRGKALSIAYLGFPIAEAAMPIAIVTLVLTLGWRESFLLSSVFILVTLIPLVLILLRNFDKSKIIEETITKASKPKEANIEEQRTWAQREIVKTLDFYVFAPTVFIVGFTLTALFFFQTFIADFKGWTLEWMALNITAYAVSSLIFSILAGPLIDKYSARKIFPFVLIPMIAGLLVLAFSSHTMATPAFWFLVGISAGANPTVSNALYAETYGVKSLGAIRSIFTFIMVISTAAGPVVYSTMLDSGINFNQIHLLLSGVILLNIIYILVAFRYKKSRYVNTGSPE
ncbi:MAG: MFS transporter [Bacteroidetes bacterium]|nr:MAG: MFS transporter [Bacteroidota bacterium]